MTNETTTDAEPTDLAALDFRADPLAAALFGATNTVYFARGVEARACGGSAEALTLRIMRALYAVERTAAPPRQTVSAATEAAHGAIVAHVAALALPSDDALVLTATLFQVIGSAISSYADLTAAALAEAATDGANVT